MSIPKHALLVRLNDFLTVLVLTTTLNEYSIGVRPVDDNAPEVEISRTP